MAFERLLRLTKKCPGYVVSGLRNASVGIATVTQKSFESQYYISRALFGTRSLFAMTGAPKNRQLKNHHSYNNYNPILFQYRNIRHLLGMYITKQAEQEIYLIAQKKLGWCPPPKKKTYTPSTSQARRWCHIHGA